MCKEANHRQALFLFTTMSVAVALPFLLAFNPLPSATVLNQVAAVGGWGALLALNRRLSAGGHGDGGYRRAAGDLEPLPWALVALMGAVVVSWCFGALPASCAWDDLAQLAAAWVVLYWAGKVAHAAAAQRRFFEAVLLAAVLSAIVGTIQFFAPQWADGVLVAYGPPGRAIGNVRQHNHLGSLLLWGVVCLATLAQSGAWFRRRWGQAGALFVYGFLLWAVVFTASRTAVLNLLLLAAWGAVDRRLLPRLRLALVGAPLLYAALWLGTAQWAQALGRAFMGVQRLEQSDVSNERFAIWSNALEMIRAQPWTGVGWGEFNFAWTLTPFAHRPVEFFNHVHNLPLHLAVELGVPLAALVLGLLLWALARAAKRAWQAPGSDGVDARAALMMVLLIGVHSLLEYPLWYAHFLLPTAFAWGWALRRPAVEAAAAPNIVGKWAFVLPLAGVAMLVGSIFVFSDYGKVVAIFNSDDTGVALEKRIERGRGSLFFAHHAEYAAATTTEPPSRAIAAFDSASHSLLDVRLMIAWARALKQTGETDKARYLMARLREFNHPSTKEFFSVCDTSSSAEQSTPTHCEAPVHSYTWRDFLR